MRHRPSSCRRSRAHCARAACCSRISVSISCAARSSPADAAELASASWTARGDAGARRPGSTRERVAAGAPPLRPRRRRALQGQNFEVSAARRMTHGGWTVSSPLSSRASPGIRLRHTRTSDRDRQLPAEGGRPGRPCRRRTRRGRRAPPARAGAAGSISAPAGSRRRYTTAPGSPRREISGPAVIEEMSSTTLLPPGCSAHRRSRGQPADG